MQFTTLTQLIQDVTREVAQVPGSGVQLYGEDTIADKLQQIFVSVCGEAWWPHLMKWSSHVLDETTGRVTAATRFPTSVLSFYNIRALYAGTTQVPLAQLPPSLNPYAMSGSVPRYVEALHEEDDEDTSEARYLFRVWPLTSTGTIYAHARHIPTTVFEDGTRIVPFDRYTLVAGAAMLYATDDGNNPAAVVKYQTQFTDFLQKCKNELWNHGLELDTRMPFSTDTWQEREMLL